MKKENILKFRQTTRARVLGLILTAACAAAGAAVAQTATSVDYTSGTYTQDFSGLSTTPNSSFGTAGTAFSFVSDLGSGTTMDGWYGATQAGGKNVYLNQLGTSGTSTTGGFVAFGSSTTPQALGLKSTSTSEDEIFGVELLNTSGTTLTSIAISFEAAAWWNANGSSAKDLQFGYTLGSSTLPTAVTSGDPSGYQANLSFTGSSSSNASTLALTSDDGSQSTTVTTGSDSAINGTAMGDFLTLSDTISGISWAPNEDLWLTWDYSTNTKTSPGLAIGDLDFSALSGGFVAQNLTWNTTSGAWDTTTTDWTASSGAATYADTDNVTFAGSGGTVVVTSTGVSPGSVTVSNNTGTYTFTGGAINGTCSVTMNGTGVLVLSSSNGYSGGTNLNAGTTQIDNDDELGAASGGLTFAGGTLQTTAAITSARAITINTGGGAIDTHGNTSTFSGPVAINDTFVKTGSGNLILNGAVTTGATNPVISILAGTLTLGEEQGTVNLNADNTNTDFTGNLAITGTNSPRINFNSGIFGGGGQIQVQNSGVLFTQASGTGGATINNNFALNSGSTAFTKGDVTQQGYTPGTFVTNIGGTKGGGLVINGVISGNSDVNIGNSGTGGGIGFLNLNAQNTYTGVTEINTGAATITLGINNALPTTTDLINNTQSGASGVATLNLNGFNQQVNSLSSGTATSASLLITNQGSTMSTLTVSGSTTAATAFSGTISDGASQIAVVKAGTSTLTLSGNNSYSGGTTIAGGSLLLSGNGTAGTGNIFLASGTLDLSQVSNSAYSINSGQTLGGTGTVNLGGTNLTVNGLLNSGSLTINGGTLSLTSLATFQFTLGSISNSNEISLINNAILSIGSGVINLSNFTFSETTGFAPGVYTLIAASAMTSGNTLGSTDLTETLNGDTATLGMTGDNITLTIAGVPEPKTVILAIAGIAGVLVLRRRHRRAN